MKVKDTGMDISKGSRADAYWLQRGFADEYKRLRTPQLSYNYKKSIQAVYTDCMHFNITGIEFGNWVNGESRYNFLVGAVIAMKDMALATGIGSKFIGGGLRGKHLGLSFGARGTGTASAHFEPGNFVINLTREDRGDRFGQSGGIGAFAHEYGHFLDYWFGTFRQPGSPRRSLSLGPKTTTDISEFPSGASMAGIVNKIVQLCIWEKPGEKTSYYTTLRENAGSEYWYRHNEIFARCFEQYVGIKLRRKDIINKYLTSVKYQNWAYPSKQLAEKLVPHFDRLILLMRKKFR